MGKPVEGRTKKSTQRTASPPTTEGGAETPDPVAKMTEGHLQYQRARMADSEYVRSALELAGQTALRLDEDRSVLARYGHKMDPVWDKMREDSVKIMKALELSAEALPALQQHDSILTPNQRRG